MLYPLPYFGWNFPCNFTNVIWIYNSTREHLINKGHMHGYLYMFQLDECASVATGQ